MVWRRGTYMTPVSPTGCCCEELEAHHTADLAKDLKNAEPFHWMEAKPQNRHPTPTGPDHFTSQLGPSAQEVETGIPTDISTLQS